MKNIKDLTEEEILNIIDSEDYETIQAIRKLSDEDAEFKVKIDNIKNKNLDEIRVMNFGEYVESNGSTYYSKPFGHLCDKSSPVYDMEEYEDSVNAYEKWVKPIGDISIFSVNQYDSDSPPYYILQPKSYWDVKKCHCDDSSIYDLYSQGFGEACESTFEAMDESISIEDNIGKLVSLGFKFSKSFQKFMQGNDDGILEIDGIPVYNWIINNYPDCVIP